MVREPELISVAIKALRSRLGETQAGMARLLGASLRTYDRWEAGGTIPRGNTLVKILALCRDKETKSLFDPAGGSSASEASGNHPAPSVLSAGPRDRLRVCFRNSCLAAIAMIYESAVLGSAAADETLRSYAGKLNREAINLAGGLLKTKRPPGASRAGS